MFPYLLDACHPQNRYGLFEKITYRPEVGYSCGITLFSLTPGPSPQAERGIGEGVNGVRLFYWNN
jgi:hypothetical protein